MRTFLPNENGKYLYLIICLICRFMVTKNNRNQYISRMGQKTGTSNTLKHVSASATRRDLVEPHLGQRHSMQQLISL